MTTIMLMIKKIFTGVLLTVFLFHPSQTAAFGSDPVEIPADFNSNTNSEIIVNPVANTNEVIEAKNNYGDSFTRLLDSLAKTDSSASAFIGNDGQIHVMTRSQDGSTTYVVNGTVVWNGCGFSSCISSNQSSSNSGDINTNPIIINESLAGIKIEPTLDERIRLLETEIADLEKQISINEISQERNPGSGVSNSEVLKSIIALQASQNKQLQALQKLKLIEQGVYKEFTQDEFIDETQKGVGKIEPTLDERIRLLETEIADLEKQISINEISQERNPGSGVSNSEVLKSIIALQASQNKQLQALQKLKLIEQGVYKEFTQDEFIDETQKGVGKIEVIQINHLWGIRKVAPNKATFFNSGELYQKNVIVILKKKLERVIIPARIDSKGRFTVSTKFDLNGYSATVKSSHGKKLLSYKINK